MGAVYSSKHRLVWVEIARTSDLGENDTQFSVLSHLGNVLKPGDSVLGYDLTTANINDDNVEEMQRKGSVSLPDIILVRKHYPRWRSKHRNRGWKLRGLAVQAPDKPGAISGANAGGKDYEMFLRDLEEDDEMRSKVQIYRRDGASNATPAKVAADGDEDVEQDAPTVPLEEMLSALAVGSGARQEEQQGGEDAIVSATQGITLNDDDDDDDL